MALPTDVAKLCVAPMRSDLGSLRHNEPLALAARGGGATPPAVLHKLEEAGCLDDRSPPLRDLIRRGRTPPPLARSVSLWRTLHPMHYSMVGTEFPGFRTDPRRRAALTRRN
jgi:hypothetical protein